MSTLREGSDRLSTCASHYKIRPIETLNLPAVHRESSPGPSVISTDDSYYHPSEQGARRAIPIDEPCMISKKPGYLLEKVYFLRHGTNGEVEEWGLTCYLHYLGVVPQDFKMSSASNMTRLDLNLHHAFERLGLFIITCSKTTLEAMIELVKKANCEPVRNVRNGVNIRQFNLMAPPFSDATYELVALYPNHLLPNGTVLPIYTTNIQGRLDYKAYVVSDDGALREGRDATSPRLPAFSNPNEFRTEEHHLNPFLVILNAEITLRRFKRTNPNLEETLCADYCELVELTLQLCDLIYEHERVECAYVMYDVRKTAYNKPKLRREAILNGELSDHNSDDDGQSNLPRLPTNIPAHGLACDFANYIRFGRAQMIAEEEALKSAMANDDNRRPEETEDVTMSSTNKVQEWQSRGSGR